MRFRPGTHYAWRTEQTYREWAWRFVRWVEARSGKLDQAGETEVKAFLSELATRQRASASAQKQALNALVFLLREALGRNLGAFGDFTRARKVTRVPVVLTRQECEQLFAALEDTPRLMAELMYGSGLRLTELLGLRIKDVDLERRQLIVRAGKGDKDRVTVLPESLVDRLRAQRERLRGCTPRISSREFRASGCQRDWRANGPRRANSGNGSGSFPLGS